MGVHVNTLSLSLAHIQAAASVFYVQGSLSAYCRSSLIRGEVRNEYVCSSSYESHLALSSSVIYAFDNNNPEMLSTTTK